MRFCLTLAVVTSTFVTSVVRAEPYTPAPADQIPGYSSTVLPCKIVRPDDEGATRPFIEVVCAHRELEDKGLRELAILRNTIYARYGWDGFRKPWLRDHFHAQPWFKANPAFNYKLASEVDKKNAHLIAAREQSLTSTELERMQQTVYARRGKIWNDAPEYRLPSGKTVRSCKAPKGGEVVDEGEGDVVSNDCRFKKEAWYKPDPTYTDARLTAEDKIELGLISRAMGSFALDGNIDHEQEGKSAGLDKLLEVKALRQLSMRDLRLLRNTIYARRGRTFKSEILRDHFRGMSWYKPDTAYSDARLSRTDQRNIALIKSVENEFGGPLSDEDYLAEPTVDGA